MMAQFLTRSQMAGHRWLHHLSVRDVFQQRVGPRRMECLFGAAMTTPPCLMMAQNMFPACRKSHQDSNLNSPDLNVS